MANILTVTAFLEDTDSIAIEVNNCQIACLIEMDFPIQVKVLSSLVLVSSCTFNHSTVSSCLKQLCHLSFLLSFLFYHKQYNNFIQSIPVYQKANMKGEIFYATISHPGGNQVILNPK